MKKLMLFVFLGAFIVSCQSNSQTKKEMEPPFKIVQLPAMIFSGVSEHVDQSSMDKFPLIWGKFMQNPSLMTKAIKPGEFWGVSYDFKFTKEGFSMKYLAGVAVKEEQRDLKSITNHQIKATTFAVFSHKGKLDTLKKTYDLIHQKWIAESDYKQIGDFELEFYNHEYKQNSDDSVMYIYVPVEKK